MFSLGRPLVALAAGLLLLPMASPLAADPAVEITEWEVPWENTRPRDPWVAGPERVWFVGQRGDYLATLNPINGEFERFDLATGVGPHTVIADERGAWYAGHAAGHVGRLAPESGDLETFTLPDGGTIDAHSMAFTSDGDIWFTAPRANRLGRLDASSLEIALFEIPTAAARPYGMVVDDEDRPWATLFGNHRLATVVNGQVQEIELPREQSRPRRLAVTGEGHVWYVDYAGGYLGRYAPESGDIDEWQLPAGNGSRPYAMTADDEGRIWLVETGPQPNRLVGFDPENETFTEPVALPSGGGTVRHMVFDAESRALWFGTDANTIGRAELR